MENPKNGTKCPLDQEVACASRARPAQPITRDLEPCSRTNSRQVSWLTDPRARPPSRSFWTSDVNGRLLPAHSDEIAQVFHLFPFYPAPRKAAPAPSALKMLYLY